MSDVTQDPEADRWHYRPEGPVGLNPLFSWPPDPKAVWDWYRGAWLELTSVLVTFLLARLDDHDLAFESGAANHDRGGAPLVALYPQGPGDGD